MCTLVSAHGALCSCVGRNTCMVYTYMSFQKKVMMDVLILVLSTQCSNHPVGCC